MGKAVYNILHAEDNDFNYETSQNAIKEFFRDSEIKFVFNRAKDGNEVYRYLISSEERVEILLLDLDMPNWNGFDTARDIAKKYPDIPIIIISAYAENPQYKQKLEEFKNKGIICGYYNLHPCEKWCTELYNLVNEQEVSILHISDIHMGEFYAFKNCSVKIEKLFENLMLEIQPVDLMIVSGDISSTGVKTDFIDAMKFFEKIKSISGLDHDHFVIVPGNHDFIRECDTQNCFNNYISFINNFQQGGESKVFKYFPNEMSIGKYSLDSMTEYKNNIGDKLFSLTTYDDIKTLVIGMNSISTDKESYRYGIISENQLINVQKALDKLLPYYNDYFKIAAFHHNIFEVPCLLDEKWKPALINQGMVLKSLFRNNVRVIFHGHSHYAAAYKFLPYYFDSEKSITSFPGYIIASGTFSGQRASPMQFFFSVNHLKYRINLKKEVSCGILEQYSLKLDNNMWLKSNSIALEF
ncbi:MAG TPA: metallophosphoesterase [Clostridia bacterium]|nr:metallophosphoesterase [Clostridia bacterium]